MRAQGKLDEAVASLREVVRLAPDQPVYACNLGSVLCEQGKFQEAEAEYREAIRLRPDFALAKSGLGVALEGLNKLAESHYSQGNAMSAQGTLKEAVVEYREAIRLRPDHAEAYCHLGQVLLSLREYAGSLSTHRKANELGSKQPGWGDHSARWIAEAEQRAALVERLPSILKGEDGPKDNAERLSLAQVCYDKKYYGAAA